MESRLMMTIEQLQKNLKSDGAIIAKSVIGGMQKVLGVVSKFFEEWGK